MKKQTQALMAEPSARLSLEDALEEHPFMDWISKHGKNIFYVFLTAFSLLFIMSLWLSRSTSEAAVDYQNANRYFQQFEKQAAGSAIHEESLANLNSILEKNPNLHSKYDGQIAQTLINRNQIDKAMPFVNATLQRTSKDSIANYSQFSKITTLIGASQNQQALEQSVALKLQLLDRKQKELSQEGDDFLFAINLLRIAFLQQAIGAQADEINAWQDWAQYSNVSSSVQPNFDAKAFASAAQLFSDGNVSLADYIDSRLKTLSK